MSPRLYKPWYRDEESSCLGRSFEVPRKGGKKERRARVGIPELAKGTYTSNTPPSSVKEEYCEARGTSRYVGEPIELLELNYLN